MEIVDGKGPLAHATVAHAGHQEQAKEILGRLSATHRLLGSLVVIDDSSGCRVRIIPTSPYDEFAPRLLEFPQVRIRVAIEGLKVHKALVFAIEIKVRRFPSGAGIWHERQVPEPLARKDLCHGVVGRYGLRCLAR